MGAALGRRGSVERAIFSPARLREPFGGSAPLSAQLRIQADVCHRTAAHPRHEVGRAPATLELSQRNVAALAAKLDDPLSVRTLVSPCRRAMVRAVEDTECSDSAVTAAAAEGVVLVSRSQLRQLGTVGARVLVAGVRVDAVTNAAHYRDRLVPPGEVYMPSSGDRW